MTTQLNKALTKYEIQVEQAQLAGFAVYIQKAGVLLKSPPEVVSSEQFVPLIPEVLTSLRAFFYEVEVIEFGSENYTTLKSLVDAHLSIRHQKA